MWVGGTLVSSYFAYVLREYKNRMYVTHEKLETALIDAKIQEIHEKKLQLARNSKSQKKGLTESLLSRQQ